MTVEVLAAASTRGRTADNPTGRHAASVKVNGVGVLYINSNSGEARVPGVVARCDRQARILAVVIDDALNGRTVDAKSLARFMKVFRIPEPATCPADANDSLAQWL